MLNNVVVDQTKAITRINFYPAFDNMLSLYLYINDFVRLIILVDGTVVKWRYWTVRRFHGQNLCLQSGQLQVAKPGSCLEWRITLFLAQPAGALPFN
jgi:hypothetical protein